MQSSDIDNAQVHDLLQIDPKTITDLSAPYWVKQELRSCPWVVVRRAEAPSGEIAVGVRGNTRSERWGGFFAKKWITKIVRPAELLIMTHSSAFMRRAPAIRVLPELVDKWCDLALPWGPTGSVGFELATGRRVTTDFSDLDITIRAPSRITVEQALWLWQRAMNLQPRVDIRVETPACGFSLPEYACTSPTRTRILLRYPDGATLGNDPWGTDREKNEPEQSKPTAVTQ